MNMLPMLESPMRPNRKERRYSTTCRRASQLLGREMPRMPMGVTLQPLTGRITPPVATTSGRSRKGRVARSRASCSMRQSPSTQHTRG